MNLIPYKDPDFLLNDLSKYCLAFLNLNEERKFKKKTRLFKEKKVWGTAIQQNQIKEIQFVLFPTPPNPQIQIEFIYKKVSISDGIKFPKETFRLKII